MSNQQIGYAPRRYGPGLQNGRVRRATGSQQQWGRYRLAGPFSFRGDEEAGKFLKRTFDTTPELYFRIDEPGATITSIDLIDSAGVTTTYTLAGLSRNITAPLPPGTYRVVMRGTNAAGDAVTVTDRLRIVTRLAKLYRDGSAKLNRDGSGKLWRAVV